MINEQTRALAAQMLRTKLANELANDQGMHPSEAMHESAESPEAEMLEHSPGGYEAGGEEHPEHGDSAEVEHMLSQLSPEELEHLATQLHGDHAGAEEHPEEHDTAGLAQALEQHLAQSPEASPEGLPAEKAAALQFVKSASYIEGFIDHALSEGANVKEAVDMYDYALADTLEELNKEAGAKLMRRGARVLKPGDRMPTADIGTSLLHMGLDAKTRAKHYVDKAKKYVKKTVKDSPKAVAAGVGTAGVGVGFAAGRSSNKDKSKDEESAEKTAAYYDGVFERAAEYGLSYNDAVDFIKSANIKETIKAKSKDIRKAVTSAGKYIKGKTSEGYATIKGKASQGYATAKDKASKGYETIKNKASEGYASAKDTANKRRGTIAGVGGLAAGYRLGKGKSKDEESSAEKTAAYCTGIFKQALAYGYSENDAARFVESVLNKEANMFESLHKNVSK